MTGLGKGFDMGSWNARGKLLDGDKEIKESKQYPGGPRMQSGSSRS